MQHFYYDLINNFFYVLFYLILYCGTHHKYELTELQNSDLKLTYFNCITLKYLTHKNITSMS